MLGYRRADGVSIDKQHVLTSPGQRRCELDRNRGASRCTRWTPDRDDAPHGALLIRRREWHGDRGFSGPTSKHRIKSGEIASDDRADSHGEQLLPSVIDDCDAANTAGGQGCHHISVEAPKGAVHDRCVDLPRDSDCP
jgi:hypothetical protein